MAQRVTGFARRPAGTRAAEKARAAGQPEGEPVPLDLPALIAPYKRHRGISVRVERLGHGARLSQGRNNGDRSWSLAPDELDGCEYLPATEFYDSHILSVRVVSLDGGDGETLAVMDIPIEGRNMERAEIKKADGGAAGATAAELNRLRDELVKAKSALAARETDLATARRSAEALERSRQSLKAEFATAEAAWDRELREQLDAAAAEAQEHLAKLRAEWESEQQTSRKSRTQAQQDLEQQRKRWQQEAQAALAKAQAEWKMAEASRLSAAEAGWREQSSKMLAELRTRAEQAEASLLRARAAMASANKGEGEARDLREQVSALHLKLTRREAELSEARNQAELARKRAEGAAVDLQKAEQAWKSAEAVRLAAAESRWKADSAKSVAEITSRLERAEQELREAHSTAERARSQSQDTATELKRAEEAWKAAERVRMAGVEARWKEQLNKAVAEVTARLERSETALAEARAQAEARQHQIAAVQTSLAARDAELAKARSRIEDLRSRSSVDAEQARAQWQQELETALAEAQERFESGEAARLAAAEMQWKAQLATTAAQTTAQLEKAESALLELRADSESYRNESEAELSRLRGEVAFFQSTLAAREHEIAEARTTAEQARATADQSLQTVAAQIEKARKQWKKEADGALHRAEQVWRNEEVPRLAQIEAKLREQIASEMLQVTQRAERAEAAIADARLCAEALRHELGAAQATLESREVELAEARAMLEQDRDRTRHAPINIDNPDRRPRWEEDEEERKAQFRRRLFRDFAVVACLAVLTFMLFPRVQPVVADAWPQSLSLKSDLQPLLEMAGLSRPSVTPAPVETEKRATVNVRVANLREEPSTAAAVLTKLVRNAEVTPVERRGKWVLVRIGDAAHQKQGWISNAVLQDTSIPAAKQ